MAKKKDCGCGCVPPSRAEKIKPPKKQASKPSGKAK